MTEITSPPTTARRSRAVALIIAASALPMFMATLDNLVMTNALPVLHREMGASVEELQWFMNAYALAFAGAILIASALGDRFGRRTVFTLGILLFGAGSLFAALSADPGQLIIARAVQGLGGAAIMPLSLALLTGAVPAARRALAIGIWGGISGLGVAVGPLVGGTIMDGWNWQAIFWINVPIAILAVPFALLVLNNDFGARVRIDVPGALLAAGGVLALVHAIVRGNDDGWDSLDVIAEITLGAVLLVVFLIWQARAQHPLVPLRMFRDRSFSMTNIVGFAFSFGTFGAVFLLIQYLQVVHGATPLEAAVQTTPWTIAPMFVAPLAGIFTPRVGSRALIVTGLALQGLALTWLAIVIAQDTQYAEMVAPFVLAGVGMGLVFAPSTTALLATLGLIDHAKASGVNATIRELGVALGTAVMTAIFVGAGGQLTPDLYVDAARPAILTGAAVLAVGTLLALLLPPGRATDAAEPASAELATVA